MTDNVDSVTEHFLKEVEESEADVADVEIESFYKHELSYGGLRVRFDVSDADDLEIVEEIAEDWPYVQSDENPAVFIWGKE